MPGRALDVPQTALLGHVGPVSVGNSEGIEGSDSEIGHV